MPRRPCDGVNNITIVSGPFEPANIDRREPGTAVDNRFFKS
jgi:hypothetical protein